MMQNMAPGLEPGLTRPQREVLTTGAVLLNVKVSDERRRCGDACVTFLLGLFRRRRIGDVRRRRIGDAESVTQSQWRRVGDAESVTQSQWRKVSDAESVTQSQWRRVSDADRRRIPLRRSANQQIEKGVKKFMKSPKKEVKWLKKVCNYLYKEFLETKKNMETLLSCST